MSKKRASNTIGGGPPTKILRYMSDGPDVSTKPLTIVAGTGQESKAFYLDTKAATLYSDFVAAALRHDWREAQQLTIKLPEEEPEMVEVFVRFVQHGYIYSTTFGDQLRDLEWSRLRLLWMLGDNLLSRTFKDAIIDSFIEKIVMKKAYSGHLHSVFLTTAGPCTIRRLAVDLFIWNSSQAARTYFWKGIECHRDFVWDLVERQRELLNIGGRGKAPWETNPCAYHEHSGPEMRCYQTMFKYN